MKTGVARFFGVTERGEAEKLMHEKWANRSGYLMASNGLFGHTVKQISVRQPQVQTTYERTEQSNVLLLDEVDFFRLFPKIFDHFCFYVNFYFIELLFSPPLFTSFVCRDNDSPVPFSECEGILYSPSLTCTLFSY